MSAEKIQELIKRYFDTRRSHPQSIRLYSIRKQILFAVLEGDTEPANVVTKEEIEQIFLKRLYAILESPLEIEQAIIDRQSIPRFTKLKDCDFSILKYDNNRVDAVIKEFLISKNGRIIPAREAIMIEAILCGGVNAVLGQFLPKIIDTIAFYPELEKLTQLNLPIILREFCIEALASICPGKIIMSLEDSEKGYSFNSAFLKSLAAKIGMTMAVKVAPQEQLPMPHIEAPLETVKVVLSAKPISLQEQEVDITVGPLIETVTVESCMTTTATILSNEPLPTSHFESSHEKIQIGQNVGAVLKPELDVSVRPAIAMVSSGHLMPIPLLPSKEVAQTAEIKKTEIKKPAQVHAATIKQAPTFAERHPGLFVYLTVLGLVFLMTVALTALCFVPVVGPMFSIMLGSALGSICSFFGLQAGLNVFAAGVSAALFATLGVNFSLTASAGLLAISFFGAANALMVTLTSVITESVMAFKIKTPKKLYQLEDKVVSPVSGTDSQLKTLLNFPATVRKQQSDGKRVSLSAPSSPASISFQRESKTARKRKKPDQMSRQSHSARM